MPPVIDLHCDTLYRLSYAPERFFTDRSETSPHVSYSGLKTAGTLLQCFALFTDLCETANTVPTVPMEDQYTCFRRILDLSDGNLVQIRTASHLKDAIAKRKTGALLTLEESCLSENPVALLPGFFSMGVRIATLTWDYSNLLASSAVKEVPSYGPLPLFSSANSATAFPGLTPRGFEFISEAERLGIIIDVSHLSDESFYDVVSHSKKPFLASHSNARSVCNVPRNLSDDMLRILAKRGGLTGLCLHEPFLTSSSRSWDDIADALAKHVAHILSVAGSEVLALGTDFDGTPGNCAVPDAAHLYRLEHILTKAGLSAFQIENIFYKNALRFLTENLPV